MADPEPGAPIAKDAIDPELVKLARARPKVGVITAAGIVLLSVMFVLRLGADRRFAGQGTTPTRTTADAIVGGNVDIDQYVVVDAEPVVSHTMRAGQTGSTGLRVAPVRGTADRLWVVLPGNGWDRPGAFTYQGRLRKLSDLPFAAAIDDHTAEHPLPVFAASAQVRDAFRAGSVKTITGDAVTPADRDEVAFDVVDPSSAALVASFTEKLPDVKAWTAALVAAGIPTPAPPVAASDRARFEVPLGVAEVTAKLAEAKLAATRVEAVTRHYKTTWGALKASPPGGFLVDGKTIPDAQVELVGLFTARGVPADAYAILTGERPDDYWYVMPITVGLGVLALVFAWALVRAVRRDLMPTRAA